MRLLAVVSSCLLLTPLASAQAPDAGAAPGGEDAPRAQGSTSLPWELRAYASRRVACEQIRISWLLAGFPSSENEVVVKNEVGNTGLRFLVDRKNGRIVGMQAWRELAGMTVTIIPAGARLDWVNCQDAQPVGGILIEWVDAPGSQVP